MVLVLDYHDSSSVAQKQKMIPISSMTRARIEVVPE